MISSIIATLYAINLLIIEDLKALGLSLTEQDANRIRQNSKKVGLALHNHHNHLMVDDLMNLKRQECGVLIKPYSLTFDSGQHPNDHT